MKSNRLLLWFVLALIGLAVLLRFKHTHRAEPAVTPVPTAPTVTTTTPTPTPPPTHPEVHTIQDGQTIDFSSGRPVVTSTTADDDLKADLEAMQAASAGVTFSGEDLPPVPAESATLPPPPAPAP